MCKGSRCLSEHGIMARVLARQSLALAVVVAAVWAVTGAGSKSLNITNSCMHTVWPAISSVAGFELAPGQWEILDVPSGWSGRLWGRTLCSNSTGENTGRFTCVTGDCGSGRQDCAGGNAVPPVTLVQFTMDGSGGIDFYDISLVDGYNLPMLVTPPPQGAAPAGGNCKPVLCVVDLTGECPDELRVTSAGTGAVACKSACLAFGSPQYCCTGEYGNPDTCKPSAYSQLFKKACPRAFSYAYDGADTIFTCGASAGESNTLTYTITFCPSTNSNSANPSTSPYSQPPAAGNLPHIDGTTPYTGGGQVGGATTAASTPWRIVLVVGVLGAVTAALVALEKFLGVCKLCCSQRQGAGAIA